MKEMALCGMGLKLNRWGNMLATILGWLITIILVCFTICFIVVAIGIRMVLIANLLDWVVAKLGL